MLGVGTLDWEYHPAPGANGLIWCEDWQTSYSGWTGIEIKLKDLYIYSGKATMSVSEHSVPLERFLSQIFIERSLDL